MDFDKIDPEIMEFIFRALQGLKDDAEKLKAKREAFLWREITAPLTLNDALSRLTRNDLNKIRQNLDLKGISSLKKNDLIIALQEMIPARVEEIFLRFDNGRYDLFKKMANNGGWIPAPVLENAQIEFLLYRGLAVPGTTGRQRVLVMPVEIIEVFRRLDSKSYQQIVQRNWDLIRITQGMLYYYGTLTSAELFKMMQQYGFKPGDFLGYFQLIFDAMLYYGEIYFDGNGFSNYRVFEPKEVLREHRARADLDYYPFSREQLLQAGQPGFVDRNAAYRSVVDFIVNNYEITRDEADELVQECVYAVRIGESLGDILNFLQNHLEMNTTEILRAVSEQIVHLTNNTRQWFLKGYTPAELRKLKAPRRKPLPDKPGAEIISLQTRQKVGRNDPCPCGSGKKFKMCCGRDKD